MSGFRLSPAALADLEAIYELIEQDSAARADLFVRQFEALFERLARHPGSGRPALAARPELRLGLLSPYLCFYKSGEDDALEIIRILHERRNWAEIMTGQADD